MATEDSRKLFMAGLPDSVTEEVLRGLFAEVGANVTELTVPRDRATGRPRGFAFVRLGSDAEADRARQDLDGRIVDGKMISVRPFHADPPAGREAGPRMDRPPRMDGGPPGGGFGGGPGGPPGGGGFDRPRGPGGAGPAAPDRTLYVGNLPYDASQEEIGAMLNSAGAEAPARVYLPLDPDGRKRGFGFVTMGSAEAANAALEVLKNADMRGRRLIVNIAHPKGERPARPEGAGFSGPPGGGGGGFDRPRGPGGPPGGPGNFGPPAAPGRTGKDPGRRRKFEDGGGGGGGGRGGGGGGRKNDEADDNWRKRDDWDE